MWNAIGIACGIIGSVAVFCFIFRSQIIDLFPRLKTLGFASFSQKNRKPERDLRAEADTLLRELDNELIREQEKILSTELEKRCGLSVEAVPVLLRFLSAVAIAYRFLNDYMFIYGSQLSLLDYLNEDQRRLTGEPAESLRVFYSLAAVQYPSLYKNDSFDRWLGFLKDRIFLREDNGRMRITVYGREFLAHMVKMGWTKDRLG